MSDNKDNQNKIHVDKLWKAFMALPEEKSFKRGTQEPIIQNKAMLIEILEELQRDNLVMYESNDGNVIMI